ncbi:MAG: T9SS type A sorting domain-containing protein [Calditrichaceae bacterium]
MKKQILINICLSILIQFIYAQDTWVQQEWVRHLPGPDSVEDGPSFIKADNSGNVYVLNESYSLETRQDYQLAKYSSDGELLWLFRYDSTNTDMPTGMAIDDSDKVIITGITEFPEFNYEFCTIKLSPDGSEAWNRKFPSLGSWISNPQIITDAMNNIYVSGYGDKNIITIKYSPDGEILWTCIYNSGGNASPNGIVLDKSCNVFIITSGLIKIDSIGNFQWYKKFTDEDSTWGSAMSVAIGASDNIYTTGSVKPLNSYYSDVLTMKFNSNGRILWTKTFNGPADWEDGGHVVAVDDSENVYVAGQTEGIGTGGDLTLIKYDSSGNELWVRYYNGSSYLEDLGFGIDIDNQNNIYIAGVSSDASTLRDILSLKYDNKGKQIWKAIYSNGSDTDDFLTTRKGMTVGPFGNVYVVGTSSVRLKWAKLTIIKYKQILTDVYNPNPNIPNHIELYQNYPNPFNNITKIPLSLNQYALVSLHLYNIEGKKIKTIYNGFLMRGGYEFEIDSGSLASGVYIYSLMVKGNNGVYKKSKKLLVLK